MNAEFEAAKNAKSDAEMARHFAYSVEEVDRAVAIMGELESNKLALAAHNADLKEKVRAYEDRIDAIRKAPSSAAGRLSTTNCARGALPPCAFLQGE